MAVAAPSWRWLFGRPKPPERPKLLAAGPLTALLSGLDLADIRYGSSEVVRRLGVRIRTETWGTVPATSSEIHVDSHSDRFEVRLAAVHRSPGIDFAWQARFLGAADGRLTCEMEGEANADCRYNRIGIVILHPLALAGRRFRAGNGSLETTGVFPDTVGPQTIVDGVEQPLFPAFDRLFIELADGLALTFDLAGDLFETEDQRNWTDGSFKTYSTPLSVPIPQVLGRGGIIAQRLRLSIAQTGVPPPPFRRDGPVAISVGRPLAATMPAIGIALDRDRHDPGAAATAPLRSLAPAHLRAEIALGSPDAPAVIAKAGEIAAAVGAPLELALIAPPGAKNIRAAVGEIAHALGHLPIVRVLLLPGDEAATPNAWLEETSPLLSAIPSLAVGTGADFVVLNRQRTIPPPGVGLSYAMNPQVHDTDDNILVQSLEAQAATVQAVRDFAPSAPIHVGPITLTPRTREDVDPRLASAFGAAWTAGSAKHLGEAGAASLTYFESTGLRGVISRRAGPQLSSAIAPGEPYPVFHVLTELCRLRGSRLIQCLSSDPLRVQALVAEQAGTLTMLITAFAAEETEVNLSGLVEGSYSLRFLTPAGWSEPRSCAVGDSPFSITLGPATIGLLRQLAGPSPSTSPR